MTTVKRQPVHLPADRAASRFEKPEATGAGGLAPSDMVSRLARRDEGAFAQFYDMYAGRAFGLAYRVLGEGPAAEDAVHDAFLWVWEHAERLDAARGAPGALLLTVTHRRAIDQLRRRQRQRDRAEPLEATFDAVDEAAIALVEATDEGRLIERMRAGLGALNPEQREAIEQAYFGGKTQEQIARGQGVPLGTVKSRLRLGLNRLRTLVREEGR